MIPELILWLALHCRWAERADDSLRAPRPRVELGEKQYEHWQQSGEHPPDGKYDSRENVCHTVVTAGMIQFCGDCTHAMAGRIIPMAAFPDPV